MVHEYHPFQESWVTLAVLIGSEKNGTWKNVLSFSAFGMVLLSGCLPLHPFPHRPLVCLSPFTLRLLIILLLLYEQLN